MKKAPMGNRDAGLVVKAATEKARRLVAAGADDTMAGMTARHRPLTRTERRNQMAMLTFSGANGIGFNLLSSSLVLAVLIRTLGGSNFLVGVMANYRLLSRLIWPLAVSAYLMQHDGRKQILGAIQFSRAVIYIALGFLVGLLGATHPHLTLTALFILLFADALLMAAQQVTRLDLLGKLFPEWGQTLFFANDQLLAGALGVFTGFVLSLILHTRAGGQTPVGRYALLFILAGGAAIISMMGVLLVKEGPTPAVKHRRESITHQLRLGWMLFRRNRNYHYLLLTRISLPLFHIASPFYIVYATEVLHIPAIMIGFYTMLQVGAKLLTNFLWRWIDHRWGAQWVMKLAMSTTAAAPLIALAFGPLVRRLGLPQAVINWSFGLVYLAFGGAMSGRIIAIQSLILQVSREEPDLRPTYIAFANNIQSLAGFGALWGGAVVYAFGYNAVFILAVLFASWGVFNVYRIHLAPMAAQAT